MLGVILLEVFYGLRRHMEKLKMENLKKKDNFIFIE